MKKVMIGCGVVFGGLFVITIITLAVLGFASERGQIPDTVAVPKNKISKTLNRTLLQMGIVEPEEEVEFYYSTAFLSFKESGNLFTDRRVITYEKDQVFTARWDEIEHLKFNDSHSLLEDSVITVIKKDGDILILDVSSESELDNTFYEQLEKRWEENRSESPK